MNKKKIIAIILAVLVVLLSGASVYVATQLSTNQAVAPNAPESKPQASEPVEPAVTVAATAITYSESCSANATAVDDGITVKKEAFKDDPTNTVGNYKHTDELKKTGANATVAPGETFVYSLWATNPNSSTMSGTVTFLDVLDNNLTYVDGDNCSYESTTRTVSCTLTQLDPGTWGRGFRVKVAKEIKDGTIISNTVSSTINDKLRQGTLTLTDKGEMSSTLTGSKTAYKDVTGNTAGSYTLTTEMTTVSKSQTFVYSISIKNSSDVTASGVVIKDTLKDKPISFVDAVAGCTWNATDVELTCVSSTIKPGETKTFNYRVKTSDGIANGETVTNSAKATYNGETISFSKSMAVSSVVSCNHTCTTDTECSGGLKCDTTTKKCRNTVCLAEDDCTCAIAVTRAPTAIKTIAPTKIATVSATPSELPNSGILDLPGVAAFGGGLLLAVVGILLAL